MSKQEMKTVVLTLDDDTELECAILGTFDCNESEYIALFPQGDNDFARDGQVFLYRYIVPEDGGDPELENILDDTEYEQVSDAYDHFVNSMNLDTSSEEPDPVDSSDSLQ